MFRKLRPRRSILDAVGWLYCHREALPPDRRHTLLEESLRRTSSILALCVATSLFVLFVHGLVPAARWPYAWIAVDWILLATRLRLLRSAAAELRHGDERSHHLYALAGLTSCLVLGLGAGACVRTANPLLIGVTLGFLSGVAAGIVSRNSAFPRSALAAELLVSVPFFLETATSTHPWYFVFALIQGAGIAANVSILRANYKLIRDCILAELENRQLALHDSLTGLPNRKQLRERLTDLLASLSADRGAGEESAVVLCLDLDGFKAVNDRYGHPAGDALLRVAADRFKGAVRDTDIVARMGGDEFVIVLHRGDARDAERIAARIIGSIAWPCEIGAQVPVNIGVTIGGAIAPLDGAAVDILISRADRALYAAKRQRRGTYLRYSAAMHADRDGASTGADAIVHTDETAAT